MATGAPPTIYQVAQAVGVSASTVSRVLAGANGIAPGTRERVLAAADRMGYRRNSLASDLARRASNTIAVLLPDISNPFFSSLVKEIQILAERSGLAVLMCSTRDDERIEQRNLDVLLSKKIKHVLVMGLRADSEEVQAYEDAGLRFIALDRAVPSARAVRIHSDNFAGARAVTEHLIELGHRRIAHVHGPEYCDVTMERYEGYRAALKAHKIRYDRRLVVTSTFDETGGRTALDTLVRRAAPFTAVFASNDLIAIGVHCAARDQGLRIPRDFSLAGFDDVPAVSYTTRGSRRCARTCGPSRRRRWTPSGRARTPTPTPTPTPTSGTCVFRWSSGYGTPPPRPRSDSAATGRSVHTTRHVAQFTTRLPADFQQTSSFRNRTSRNRQGGGYFHDLAYRKKAIYLVPLLTGLTATACVGPVMSGEGAGRRHSPVRRRAARRLLRQGDLGVRTGEPGITVKYVSNPASQLTQVLQARLGTKDSSIDVFTADEPKIPSMVDRGFLLPLDTLKSEADAKASADAVRATTFKGTLYALPLWTSTSLLYYNKDLLKKAGIADPATSTDQRLTWEQLAADAKKTQTAGAGTGSPSNSPAATTSCSR
ncbi:extracellular solute-binding protein [Streptomyces sp. M19]